MNRFNPGDVIVTFIGSLYMVVSYIAESYCYILYPVGMTTISHGFISSVSTEIFECSKRLENIARVLFRAEVNGGENSNS